MCSQDWTVMHDLMRDFSIATSASHRGGRLRRVFVMMGVEIQMASHC